MYRKQAKLYAYMHAVRRLHTLLATFMTPLRSDAIRSNKFQRVYIIPLKLSNDSLIYLHLFQLFVQINYSHDVNSVCAPAALRYMYDI